jgi:hypothetical protein
MKTAHDPQKTARILSVVALWIALTACTTEPTEPTPSGLDAVGGAQTSDSTEDSPETDVDATQPEADTYPYSDASKTSDGLADASVASDATTDATDSGTAGLVDATNAPDIATLDGAVASDVNAAEDVAEPTPEELDRLYTNPSASSFQPCNCYPKGDDCDASLVGGGGDIPPFDPLMACPAGEVCSGGYPSGKGVCHEKCTTDPGFPTDKAVQDSCPEGWICVLFPVPGPEDEVWAKFAGCRPENFMRFKRWKDSKQNP